MEPEKLEQEGRRIDRQYVIWAYRLLLDREPESEATIQAKLATQSTTRELREEILNSPEYRSRLHGSPSAAATGTLTPEHVVWAFRLFLDREPENDAIVTARYDRWDHTAELRNDFLSSPEFKVKYPQGFAFFDFKRNVVIKELEGGLRIFIDLADCIIGLNVLRGSYEQSELDFIRRTLQPGQTVLDLGANIGFFTIHIANLVGPDGRVYAFEPMAQNLDLLRRSVAENAFTERAHIEPSGVGEEPGTASFVFLDPQRSASSGGSYLQPEAEPTPAGHELKRAPIVALDHYELRRPIHFIKADIEGAEPLAFRGAEDILQSDRPTILAEINPEQLFKVSRLQPSEFLAEMDRRRYDCRLLVDGAPGPIVTKLADDPTIRSVIFVPRPSG